jgi:hypothetical protein
VIYECFSFYEPFSYLNKQGDCYVNLILEETKNDSLDRNIEKIEKKFKWYCETLQIMYPKIIFIGGYRICDNKILYEFKDKLEKEEYKLIDFV